MNKTKDYALLLCFSFCSFFMVLDNAAFCDEAIIISDNEVAPRFITVPEHIENLDRAPVKFNHDKHTKALENEEDVCALCHSRDTDNNFDFTYPDKKDDSTKNKYTKSLHDACIECHTERNDESKKTGPLTCGECHIIDPEVHQKEYLPIMPEYYDPLRDTHHEKCISCHQEPAKKAEDAGGLDWKSFYTKKRKLVDAEIPEVHFDYFLHDKHEKALEEKCEKCHTLSDDRKKELEIENKEPECKDWLKEIPEDQSYKIKEYAHTTCINCHLQTKDEKKDAGPVSCKECHIVKQRSIEEMADIKRIECEQEDKILINLDNDTRMKAVPFNHESHQKVTRSCQECHHDTIQACNVCHTPEGIEKGDYVTLAESYHDDTSTFACIGCHENEKKKPNCAGCHNLLDTGLVKSSCTTCHSGAIDNLDKKKPKEELSALFPDDIKKEMEIDVIKDEYELSKFPHEKIVSKLTEISDNSTLASFFHTDQMTLCAGCHHLTPITKKTTVAQCRTCHTVRKDPISTTPALLGAYHQQCLGCHKKMAGIEEEMPQDCAGCHEEKK